MDAHEVGGLWLLREMWGFPAGVPEDERLDYLKAIMACARAKGHLTKGEKDWVIGYGAACGAYQETVDALDAYDADEDIEDILRRNMPTAKTWGRVAVFRRDPRRCGRPRLRRRRTEGHPGRGWKDRCSRGGGLRAGGTAPG